MNYSRRLIAWMPVAAWMGLIFYLSGIPFLRTELGVWDLILRKAAHVAEFAVLTFLILRAFRLTFDGFALNPLLFSSGGVSLLYAFSDEFHQLFVPGRVGCVRDVLIDGLGILLMLVLWKSKHHQPGRKEL